MELAWGGAHLGSETLEWGHEYGYQLCFLL